MESEKHRTRGSILAIAINEISGEPAVQPMVSEASGVRDYDVDFVEIVDEEFIDTMADAVIAEQGFTGERAARVRRVAHLFITSLMDNLETDDEVSLDALAPSDYQSGLSLRRTDGGLAIVCEPLPPEKR